MPSQEEKVARQSFNSSVIVAAGNLSSMVFLLVASIVVARLLGKTDYGIYSFSLTFPLFFQYFVGFGIKTAINRYSAFYISRGDFATARRLTKNAILFLVLTSTCLTILSVLSAGFVTSSLLNNKVPSLTYVAIASILIFGQGLYNFLTPAFVGWRVPLQDAVWTVVQAVLKLGFSVTLILLGFGVFGALYGYVLASLLAGIFGILVLYLTKLRKNADENGQVIESAPWTFKDFVKDVKMMVKFGVPTYVGNIIVVFSQQPIIAVVIAYIGSAAMFGNYNVATNVTQGISNLSAALTPAFFAAFASLDGMKSNTGTAFKYAVKYVSYFMMPIVIFLVGTSGFIIEILYGNNYVGASPYLQLLAIAYLPYAFGYSVLVPFVNGTGNTKVNLFMDVVEAVSTAVAVLIFVFLLKLGIYGLLVSIIVSNAAPTMFGLFTAKKYLRAEIDYAGLVRTFFVSIACYLPVYALSIFVLGNIYYLISFPIELLVYFGIYLTLMPLSGAIRTEDIGRLVVATRGIKALRRLMDIVLSYERFLIERTRLG